MSAAIYPAFPARRQRLGVVITSPPMKALPLACLLAGLACTKDPPAAPPPVDAGRDCSDGAILTLNDLMTCRMSPYLDGKEDEATLRATLERLRDLYPDPEFARGNDPRAW